MNQLKAGALLSYVTLFANSAISIVYTPIMLKLLGQSEYGVYSLASSIVGYLGVLNFGLGNAVIRYTAQYKTIKDQEECSNLYGMFSLIYGVLGIIAFAAGIVLTLNSDQFFTESLSSAERSKLSILMVIMVINNSLGIGLGIYSCIILAYEKFIFQKLTTLIGAIVSPFVTLPLLLMGYGSVSMVTITTLINLVTIFVNMYYCFKTLKIKIKFGKFDFKLFKEINTFSFFIFINLMIDKIYWSTDQIIIGKFIGTVAVSVYSIGAVFSGYFGGFAGAISGVFLSRVTSMVAKGESRKEVSDLFIRIGRVQYIIISFFLCGFIVYGQEFITLWAGANYQSSYTVALVILIPSAVPLIQSIGGVILQAKDMQKFKSILYFVISLVNVFLSIIFVQKWGIVGCALATALAFAVGNILIMNIYYWKRVFLDIPRFWLNILGMGVPFVVCLAAGIIVNRFLVSDNWTVFTAKVTVFSVFYGLLMWFSAMNHYEKDLFIAPIKSITYKVPWLWF